MDSLHTGYSTNLIRIETEDYTLYINGKLNNFKSNNIGINTNKPAFFKLEHNNKHIDIKTVISDGTLVNNSSFNMYPCFFEDDIYEILVEKKEKLDIKIYHISDDIRNNIRSLGNCLIGTFSFKGEIGQSTFKIYKDNELDIELTIEVFPTKMDYMNDYYSMMSEINEEIASLAFSFFGKTNHKSSLVDVENQTNTEFYHILSSIYDNLMKALNRIAKSPKHSLYTYERLRDVNKASKISNKTIAYINSHPEILVKSQKGINIHGDTYLPTKVIEERKENTTDIYENRFIKYIIQSIIKRLTVIENNIKARVRKEISSLDVYLDIINSFKKSLYEHLNVYYKNIGDIHGKTSMSLVFKMASGYKEVFYYYNILKKGLDISEDIYSITPKKIWNLYEIWCYIKLHNIMEELGYEVIDYGILSVKDNGLSISLLQNEEAVMTYRNNEGNEIQLWYNKIYRNLPTTDQKPDTVLCLKNKNSNENRIYIFDAKYRVSIKNGAIGPNEDDINVMHRYRDSIVSQLGNSYQFKYDTFGAYVMFPYSNEKEYIKHKFYESINKVNIGAFPMLPGSYKLIKHHISQIIKETTIEAKSRLLVNDIDDDYSKFKLKNVMIANVKDEEHLNTYIQHKFFHIPIKTLANLRLGVEYIAFYKPDDKNIKNGGIRYYSKIKEIKKYKRYECVELYKNSNEDYLRIELDEIYNVGYIKSVEYGIRTVDYTSLYLLKNATNIHELRFKSISEVRLYKKIYEISKSKGYKLTRKKDCYMLGNNKIELLSNNNVIVNGKIKKLIEIDEMIF